MAMLNVPPNNHDYDGLNENSSDLERLDVFFAILLKANYPEYVDTWKLKLKHNQQKHFEALLFETGLVTDESSANGQTSFTLTSKAIIQLNKYGSYSNFINQVEQEKSLQRTKAEEKENLELQQLRSDNILKTNQLVDYEKTKANLKKTTTATIVVAIIALLELILLLIK